MKRALSLGLRIIALIALYFLSFSVISAIVFSQQPAPNSEASSTLTALLIMSTLNAIVISYIIQRSNWSGLKLTLTIFCVLFGVITLIPQIETAVFVKTSADLLLRIVLNGLIFTAVFAPLSVLVLGKFGQSQSGDGGRLVRLSPSQWVVRLSLLAVIYTFIYFVFGYFIAWKNPAVRAYYGGTDPGSFLAQVRSVIHDTPWLFPLQILRGLLWTLIALPVIRMMKGHWWEAGLGVALLFSVVVNSQLLLPNPLMPTEVRMTHLLETATSNFLFGWIVVAFLKP